MRFLPKPFLFLMPADVDDFLKSVTQYFVNSHATSNNFRSQF
jgi:hypothetical protein